MRTSAEPPQDLVDLLTRLGLASAAEIRGVARRVERLAGGLPLFRSVWVDVLAQTRRLTRFQAAEINANRGEALAVGPFVLYRPMGSLGYASVYLAQDTNTREAVRLAVVEPLPDRKAAVAAALQHLAESGAADDARPATVTRAGSDADRLWVAGPHVAGTTAAEWLVHNGRFPPALVLETARQLADALALLQRRGLVHGDVCAAGLVLTAEGRAVLPQPGLRAAVRPEEGYGSADLQPEAYDYLAPERARDGTPPTPASDIYAWGALCWHLLAGRPPALGGNGLVKLRSIETAEVIDVRWLAPDVPESLARAVMQCLAKDPQARPSSWAQLAEMLPESTEKGRAALGRAVLHAAHLPVWRPRVPRHASPTRAPIWIAAGTACVLAALALGWSLQRPRAERPGEAAVRAALAAGTAPRALPAADSAAPLPTGTQPDAAAGHAADVRAATWEAQAGEPAASRARGEIVLPAASPLAVEAIDLKAGDCVRGAPGERPQIIVPPHGLAVGAEGVRFENIDFVWPAEHAAEPDSALVVISAAQAEFHGCTFRVPGRAGDRPAALRWTHPDAAGRTALALPSGRLALADCVLAGVSTGFNCHTAGAIVLALTNVLHVASGPLVTLDHCPHIDEPVSLVLGQVTLRDAHALLECPCPTTDARPGRLTVDANDCVFAGADEAPLLKFTGGVEPDALLAALEWTGQGSLVERSAPIAQWCATDGRIETLDDRAAAIAGLVRSGVEFAGPAGSSPAASRLTRWQAPLRSTEPPGIDAEGLPKGLGPFRVP